MTYGCESCRHIYDLEVLYADSSVADRCPNCGQDDVIELGTAPSVLEKEGLYYLVGPLNCSGPFSSPMEAQADLWNWFGENEDAKKEEAGINNRFKVIQGGEEINSQ